MLQCCLTSIVSILFVLVLASIYFYSPVETSAFYTNSQQCEFPGIPGAKFKAACVNSIWNWLFPTLFALLFVSILILFILCVYNLCHRRSDEETRSLQDSWWQDESTALLERTFVDTHVYTYGSVQFEASDEFFTNRPPPPSYFALNREPPPPYSPSIST